jgi:hypothetical protein
METRMIKQTDAFSINHNPDGGLKNHKVVITSIEKVASHPTPLRSKTKVAPGPVDMNVAHYHRRRD